MMEHYRVNESVEAIDIIESVIKGEHLTPSQAWCAGNALKYLLRLGKKDAVSNELFKAENYIHRARTGEWIDGGN